MLHLEVVDDGWLVHLPDTLEDGTALFFEDPEALTDFIAQWVERPLSTEIH